MLVIPALGIREVDLERDHVQALDQGLDKVDLAIPTLAFIRDPGQIRAQVQVLTRVLVELEQEVNQCYLQVFIII